MNARKSTYVGIIIVAALFSGTTLFSQNRGFVASIGAYGGLGAGRVNYDRLNYKDGEGLFEATRYTSGIDAFEGWKFNDYLSIGVGLGYRYSEVLSFYLYDSDENTVHAIERVAYSKAHSLCPQLWGKVRLFKDGVSPFLLIDSGYSLPLQKDKTLMKGFFFEPALGLDFNVKGLPMYLSIGYLSQETCFNAHYILIDKFASPYVYINERETVSDRASIIVFHLGVHL